MDEQERILYARFERHQLPESEPAGTTVRALVELREQAHDIVDVGFDENLERRVPTSASPHAVSDARSPRDSPLRRTLRSRVARENVIIGSDSLEHAGE